MTPYFWAKGQVVVDDVDVGAIVGVAFGGDSRWWWQSLRCVSDVCQ